VLALLSAVVERSQLDGVRAMEISRNPGTRHLLGGPNGLCALPPSGSQRKPLPCKERRRTGSRVRMPLLFPCLFYRPNWVMTLLLCWRFPRRSLTGNGLTAFAL
jgi:hypothetical protein